MRWRNYCIKCGARIPRRKRAFFGNWYKPCVCRECSDRSRAALYGSVAAADAAYWTAALRELSRVSRG